MNDSTERIHDILAHLCEVEAELAALTKKVQHARREFEKELPALKNWSVAKDLAERPHLGVLG